MLKKISEIEWQKALKVAKSLGAVAQQAKREALEEMASKMQRTIVGHINKQDLPWDELSTAWKRKKTKNKDKLYLHYGNYKAAIRGRVVGSKARAYIAPYATFRDSGVKIAPEPAMFLESLRPLWGPSYREVQSWVAAGNANPDKKLHKKLKTMK